MGQWEVRIQDGQKILTYVILFFIIFLLGGAANFLYPGGVSGIPWSTLGFCAIPLLIIAIYGIQDRYGIAIQEDRFIQTRLDRQGNRMGEDRTILYSDIKGYHYKVFRGQQSFTIDLRGEDSDSLVFYPRGVNILGYQGENWVQFERFSDAMTGAMITYQNQHPELPRMNTGKGSLWVIAVFIFIILGIAVFSFIK